MNVKDLREKLANLPDDTEIFVLRQSAQGFTGVYPIGSTGIVTEHIVKHKDANVRVLFRDVERDPAWGDQWSAPTTAVVIV